MGRGPVDGLFDGHRAHNVNRAYPLDSLVFFLILWVALMPGRLGYDEGASRRSKDEG